MNGFTEKQKSLILVNYNQLFRMFTTSKCNPKGEKIYVPYVGKIWKDNHLIRDTVICQTDYSMSRTNMVFQSLDDICYEFDLGKPIWLSSNINDFKRHAKTRFTKDSFIEQIDFDYLEIEVIEE